MTIKWQRVIFVYLYIDIIHSFIFLFSIHQLFRRVAAALPGMEANEKTKEDSTYIIFYEYLHTHTHTNTNQRHGYQYWLYGNQENDKIFIFFLVFNMNICMTRINSFPILFFFFYFLFYTSLFSSWFEIQSHAHYYHQQTIQPPTYLCYLWIII